MTTEFTQLPNQLSLEDYETGRQQLVDYFSDHNGVIGIYDYGTVEHPGISDLDIMLVVNPERDLTWVSDVSTDFDPLVNKLVGRGNVILIDQETLERIHYVDPNLDLRPLAGKEIKRKQVPPDVATYRDHASVVDWLPERVYQIERLQSRETMPVMRALQLLKSLGYSLRIVDDLIGFDDGASFVEQVTELRGMWFSRSQSEREAKLFDIVEAGLTVGRKALAKWFATRPNAVFDNLDPADAAGALSYFDGLAFISEQPTLERRDDWTTIGVPEPWFDHYRAYAAHDSVLGTLIDRSMEGERRRPAALTNEYESFLDTKLDICSRNFRWVGNVGRSAGAFRFGFLLDRRDWDDERFELLREGLQSLADGYE